MERARILVRDKLRTLVTEHKIQLMHRALEDRSRYVSFAFEEFYHDHNIHAAMRSIESCGFQDIYIINNRKTVASNLTVTQGAEHWLTVHSYEYAQNSTQACFHDLKASGYTLVRTTPHSTYTLNDLPLDNKIALIFGNERRGLSEYALAHVDLSVAIPMYGFTESYNVSVSASLIAYELRKRIQSSIINWHISEQEKFDLELTWLKRLVRGSEYIEENILSQVF